MLTWFSQFSQQTDIATYRLKRPRVRYSSFVVQFVYFLSVLCCIYRSRALHQNIFSVSILAGLKSLSSRLRMRWNSGMSGIGNGKWPSLLPTFGIGIWNEKFISHCCNWEWEWKIQFPTFGIGNDNEKQCSKPNLGKNCQKSIGSVKSHSCMPHCIDTLPLGKIPQCYIHKFTFLAL